MSDVDNLGKDDAAREEEIVRVFSDAFADLIENDPDAFRRKFRGFVVSDVSPYEADLDWDLVADYDEILPLVRSLGQATAKVHCVPDAGSDQTLVEFSVEQAINEAIGDRSEALASTLADFGRDYAQLVREDHRRFVDAFRNGAIPGLPVH